MPEVVEVNVTAQWLKKQLKGSKIESIEIISGRYSNKPFEGYKLFEKSKLIDIKSKGKFLWFEFKDFYILNTFGLTGEWTNENDSNTRIKLIFNNNEIYFNDIRNFGTLKITNDKKVLQKKLDELGMDLLTSTYTYRDIYNKIEWLCNHKQDKELVKILMDQTEKKGIGCGIGNYLAAEIMYDAKLSPKRKISTLSKSDVKALTKSIQKIIIQSYQTRLDEFLIKGKKYHDHVITNNDFVLKVYRKDKDPKGNKVSSEEIIKGRTTYYVKNIQI